MKLMLKAESVEGFLWGASTSAYQVEGRNHNQWSQWELANAIKLAKTAQQRLAWLPNWSDIQDQAQDPNNYISGPGVDHYNRYEEDFDYLKQLNLNSFRFGIEWSRIEPEEGKWDKDVINHYKKYIAALKSRDIQPVINLWHWTAPLWFEEKGGFTKKANIKYFVRFAEHIAQDLVVPCKWVIIINEANSYIGMTFVEGQWPPQKRKPLQAIRVYYNLAQAHRRVYEVLKKVDSSLIIGAAHQCNNNQPKRPHNIFDRIVAASANYGWNWWWLNRIKKHQDFVGFNYYFTDYFRGVTRANPQRFNKTKHTGQRGLHAKRRNNPLGPLNDLGWYMEPASIYKVIVQLNKRYKKPILVTETGVADAEDKYRQWWIAETLAGVARAQREGIRVLGYFHWSLLDNFEWSTGWWPKFGLIEVDRHQGMKRQVRPSAKWFARFIAKQ